MIKFVLGGARSGKSNYAELQAIESSKQVIYIATAEAGDLEMQLRINRHRQNRPQDWVTIEEPRNLASILDQYNRKNCCLLVDCLTLWLTNILFDKHGQVQQNEFDSESLALLNSLENYIGELVLVSNEVGLGIVAMDPMTRRFVDEAGLLHQKIAEMSDQVVLVTAGLPQILK